MFFRGKWTTDTVKSPAQLSILVSGPRTHRTSSSAAMAAPPPPPIRSKQSEIWKAAMARLALLAVPVALLLSLSFLLLRPASPPLPFSRQQAASGPDRRRLLRVYVAELPRALNHGLLDLYWSLPAADSRIPASSDPDHPPPRPPRAHSPYPDSPLIKQYSAEYWLLASLQPGSSSAPAVRVVADWRDADVVFVPFFATLSAEMELGWGAKGAFRRKEGNEDYRRQREVVDRVTAHPAWRRSGGRDHVFVLTGTVIQLEIGNVLFIFS